MPGCQVGFFRQVARLGDARLEPGEIRLVSLLFSIIFWQRPPSQRRWPEISRSGTGRWVKSLVGEDSDSDERLRRDFNRRGRQASARSTHVLRTSGLTRCQGRGIALTSVTGWSGIIAVALRRAVATAVTHAEGSDLPTTLLEPSPAVADLPLMRCHQACATC